MNTCSTCKWEQHGSCHRYPSLGTADGIEGDYYGIWPTVRSSDWCGEWQGKKPPLAGQDARWPNQEQPTAE